MVIVQALTISTLVKWISETILVFAILEFEGVVIKIFIALSISVMQVNFENVAFWNSLEFPLTLLNYPIWI